MNVYLMALTFAIPVVAMAQYSESSTKNHGSYTSATYGDGKAYGTGAVDDKSMKAKTFEVRFGHEFDSDGQLRVDVFHYNEGHPDNNHRDGFGSQIVFRKNINNHISAEVGVGPYFSMNTTKINGTEYDDPNLGALVSLALLANMDRLSPGLHMRFALNHVEMPGAPSTNAILIGVGKNFGSSTYQGNNDISEKPVWFSVTAGTAKTNHGGTSGAQGYGVESKIYDGPWAASVAAIVEGDDGTRVNRQGVAVQGWFVQPLNDKWTVSAGAGPYVANNSRDARGVELDGLITLQVERSVGKQWKVFASFSRVASFNRNNDRDLARVGISRKFGR